VEVKLNVHVLSVKIKIPPIRCCDDDLLKKRFDEKYLCWFTHVKIKSSTNNRFYFFYYYYFYYYYYYYQNNDLIKNLLLFIFTVNTMTCKIYKRNTIIVKLLTCIQSNKGDGGWPFQDGPSITPKWVKKNLSVILGTKTIQDF